MRTVTYYPHYILSLAGEVVAEWCEVVDREDD